MISIVNHRISIPLIFLLGVNSVPQLASLSQFIYLDVAGWSYANISTLSLIFGLVYFFLLMYLIDAIKKLSFGWINIIGGTCLVIAMVLNYQFYIAGEVGFWTLFGLGFALSFFQVMCSDLPMIALIGRFSEIVPNGLEATGITLIISLSNLSLSLQNMLAAKEATVYGVKQGYFERILMPLHINFALSVILLLVAPALVIW